MAYILILVISYNSSLAADHIEFKSLEHCQAAVVEMRKQTLAVGAVPKVMYCAAKGGA